MGSTLETINKDSIDASTMDKKLKIVKEFFIFYEQQLNIRVVDIIERDESFEEMQIRKDIEYNLKKAEEKVKQELNTLLLENIKNQKRQQLQKGKDIPKEDINIPLKVYEAKPNNLLVIDRGTNRFFKWVASQLQAILDLNILDCNVK